MYVQRDTLLLADVFENFQNMCLEIYKHDPTCFLTAPGLAWQSVFKNIKVKLDLLANIDMLLMVEKSIRGGICHAFYRHSKANNNYMEDYDKNKESPDLNYRDINNFYGWAISQRLILGDFKWVEETFQFNENFIKAIMKIVMKNMFNIYKNCMNLKMIHLFYRN